jgi:hypothetical protein
MERSLLTLGQVRGSGRGGAGLLSEDPAPCAYVLGKWLRRERQHPSIPLPASPSTTARRHPPRGVKGLRSHSHASRRAIYARSCKWTSENPHSTHSGEYYEPTQRGDGNVGHPASCIRSLALTTRGGNMPPGPGRGVGYDEGHERKPNATASGTVPRGFVGN